LSSPQYRELAQTIKALRRILPAAKSRELQAAYKAFWNVSFSVFGYYTPDLKRPYFTGLGDPRKRKDLENTIQKALQDAEERREANLSSAEILDIPPLKRQIREYRAFALPGVTSKGDSQTTSEGDALKREFPVDLEGWRYGSQSLLDEALEHQREKNRTLLTTLEEGVEQKPVLADLFEEQIQSLRDNLEEGAWSNIRVVLHTKVVQDKAQAYWQPAQRLLAIQVPERTFPSRLKKDLGSILEHELRHFGQSFLADAKGVGDVWMADRIPGPGLPSKHIMTPEYVQRGKSPGGPGKDQIHHLDDVEFYTDLPEAIQRIQDEIDGIDERREHYDQETLSHEEVRAVFSRKVGDPVEGHRDLLQYVSIDRFFKALRDYAKGKWEKAVREAYKEILGR